MKKVTVFLGSRAHFATSKSVLTKLRDSNDFELEIIIGAAGVLDKFGKLKDILELQNFSVTKEIHTLIYGDEPVAMAKTAGLGIIEVASHLQENTTDLILAIGDRYEVLSAVLPASYMNIPVAHIMGGEVSGTVDETVRHVITKFSNLHFPATHLARQRILQMGENPDFVFKVGCPRIDSVKIALEEDKIFLQAERELNSIGIGDFIDIEKEFLLVSFHPVTTEYHQNSKYISELLQVLDRFKLSTVILWPNSDSGEEQISREIRKWSNRDRDYPVRVIKNLTPESYFVLMDKTKCLVGNSSSAIREGAFIGTPSINIGNRQTGREHSANVLFVGNNELEIYKAIEDRLKHGKFEKDYLYGDGLASTRIYEILKKLKSFQGNKKFVEVQ